MTSPQPLVVAGLCAVAALLVYAPLPFVAPSQLFAQGGDASTWFLAEGANNATFSQEILVGNPGAQAVDVTVTLLPQPDAIVTQTARTYRLAGTSRLTVRLGQEFGLNGSASARIRAVAAGTTTPAPIVVERTMLLPRCLEFGGPQCQRRDDARPGVDACRGRHHDLRHLHPRGQSEPEPHVGAGHVSHGGGRGVSQRTDGSA